MIRAPRPLPGPGTPKSCRSLKSRSIACGLKPFALRAEVQAVTGRRMSARGQSQRHQKCGRTEPFSLIHPPTLFGNQTLETEQITVQVQVEDRHGHPVELLEPALGIAPEALDSVDVTLAIGELVRAVMDSEV